MQIVSVAEHQDPEWPSVVSIVFGTQSVTSPPFAGLLGRVHPDILGKMLFKLRAGPYTSQETKFFEGVNRLTA